MLMTLLLGDICHASVQLGVELASASPIGGSCRNFDEGWCVTGLALGENQAAGSGKQ